MTIDKTIDELAKNYVYVSLNKVERAKTQIAAMDYIKTLTGSNTNEGACLRRAFFDRIDYYRGLNKA